MRAALEIILLFDLGNFPSSFPSIMGGAVSIGATVAANHEATLQAEYTKRLEAGATEVGEQQQPTGETAAWVYTRCRLHARTGALVAPNIAHLCALGVPCVPLQEELAAMMREALPGVIVFNQVRFNTTHADRAACRPLPSSVASA